MSLPVYLAMTGAEFAACQALPPHLGWMACHFSAYGTGLSNLPQSLPNGSLLIVNDRMPVCGHDPALVSSQLAQAAEKLECCGVLLDFQRPGNPQTEKIAEIIVSSLPCPVAVTEQYAGDLPCPVLLPPPLFQPLEHLLEVWPDREIWLEAALCQQKATVTRQGCSFGPVTAAEPASQFFYEPKLCSRYYTKVFDDRIEFTLFRTAACLTDLLTRAEALGITMAVGLYQELGQALNQ